MSPVRRRASVSPSPAALRNPAPRWSSTAAARSPWQAAKQRLRRRSPNAKVEAVAGDLSSAEGVAAFIARAGDADILVNNVGIFEPEAIRRNSGCRLAALLRGQRDERRAPVTALSAGDDEARLGPHRFHLQRVRASTSRSEMVHYGMTKTAQLASRAGLAETAAGTGVTVNSVLPGPTRSEGVVDFLGKLSEGQNLVAGGMESEADRRRPADFDHPAARRRRRRSRTWWSMSARRRPRPPPARRCGSTAGWCARSCEPGAGQAPSRPRAFCASDSRTSGRA